jgi:hypothetical protein
MSRTGGCAEREMKKAQAKPKTTRKAAKTTVKKKAGRKKSQKKLVDQAIQNIGSKLESDEVKGTVGDLIRLIQLKKELDGETPRKIEVQWVGDKSSE